MTDEVLNFILDKNLYNTFDEVDRGTFISAMREAIEIGINEYVATQKGHVFDIWAIEQRKKHLESMRLDSIRFAEWCSNDGWIFYEQIGETRFWKNNIRNSVNQKTDQLYDKYLEYLKTKQ